MKTYALAYVADPERSLAFYEAAVGLRRRFLAPGNTYGELDTAGVTLGFVLQAQAEANLPAGFRQNTRRGLPGGLEFGFEVDDVEAAVGRAVAAGGRLYAAPSDKPWGQRIAYVRDPDGLLVELAQALAGA